MSSIGHKTDIDYDGSIASQGHMDVCWLNKHVINI